MAKKATITVITSGYASTSQMNNNFDRLNDQFENTLSLDGSTPNAMNADLDMNSNDINNAGTINADEFYLGGVKTVSTSSVPSWEGAWTTATAYVLNDMVSESGNAYICTEAHTSGTFSTDLSSGKWEVLAQKGSAGAGTGDMLASNNLSDVADVDTSLANLGGGTVGIAIFKDTTAAEVRTEISAQESNDILTDLAGLTQETNKIPYFDSATTAATLDFLDEDDMSSDSATGVPSQQSVKAYVDGQTSPGALAFIESQDLSSASYADFTGFNASLYDAYVFILSNVLGNVVLGDILWLRTSTDGGSTYSSGSTDYSYQYSSGSGGGSDSNATGILIGQSSSSGNGVSGEVKVLGPHLTKNTNVIFNSFGDGNLSAVGGGQRKSAADVDAVRFIFNTGTIVSGTITMYGLKNS